MVDSIPLPGLSASDPVPGLYVQTAFAQGASTGSGSVRKILFMGNKLSSGAATADTVIYGPDTPVQVNNEQDIIVEFGAGSEIHRMYLQVAPVNPVTPVYCIAVTESVGSKASRIVTLSGLATSSGVVRVFSGQDFVDTGFVSNDGYAGISANVAASINAQNDWAVTASADIHGAITIQAKQNGPRGNLLRCGVQVIPSGVGISASDQSFAFLAGGTTADSNAAALATIQNHNFYYIVSAANDATQFGALSAQVSNQAQPIVGNRQRCFAGSNDTISAAITIATGVNNPRAEYVWLAQSDAAPLELAARAAASYSYEESSSVPVLNFNFYGQSPDAVWSVDAPLSQAVPSRAQVQSALNNGITPIGVSQNGNTYIERRITTYSLLGSVQDYRVRDAGKVTVIDFYSDDLVALVAPVIQGKNIGNDPPDNNSSVPANVMVPRDLAALANKLTRLYGDNGLIDQVALVIQNTVAIRETNPTNRLSILVPIFVSDIVNSVGMKISQVG